MLLAYESIGKLYFFNKSWIFAVFQDFYKSKLIYQLMCLYEIERMLQDCYREKFFVTET